MEYNLENHSWEHTLPLRYLKPIDGPGIAQHMVDVAVGIKQLGYLQFFFNDKCFQLLFFLFCVAPWINQSSCALLIVKQVGILLKRIESEELDMKHVKSRRD